MNRRTPRRPSNERWMVSYADFVTLLFALFVVMYAVARSEQHKEVQVAESIDAAFRSLGIFSATDRTPAHASSAQSKDTAAASEKAVMPMNIVMGEEVMSPAEVKQDLEHLRKELTQTLSNQVAQHTVAIHMGKDGLVISLREAGFFASGSADPKPQTVDALGKIASSLSRTPYDMRIEGHTDNVPMHSAQFDSNWELSTARATRIARLMLLVHATTPEKVSAAGYAEFHPVASNDTAEGRAQNRRVDIVVLPHSSANFAAMPPNLEGLGASAPSNGVWQKIGDGK